MLTILILQANPRDETYLQLKDEYLTIEQSLRETGAPEHKIVWESRFRSRDLLSRLCKYQPDIVHFSGYGDENGKILFKGSEGKPAPFSPHELTGVFRKARKANPVNGVKLVVLNSCFSGSQAKALVKEVPVVIGTTKRIPDDCALRFSEVFYAEMGRGHSIQKVIDILKTDLELRNRGINRILKTSSRKQNGESKLKLFSRPEIRAEFNLDETRGRLKTNEYGEYSIRLWIQNAPDDVVEAIYQWNHRTFRKQFQKGFAQDPGRLFPVVTSSYGNIQVRVCLWSQQTGYCLVSTLSEALKLRYSRERSKKIRNAVEYIANH
jgi:hypothetical protein